MASLFASILAAASLMLTVLPAVAATSDPEIAAYLEGAWIDQKPDQGACTAHWYKGTEIEFEFRKSSGRALIFEHYDLFTAIEISKIDRDGDVLAVQARSRDGKTMPLYRLRMLPPDRIEFLSENKEAATAYRCGSPDGRVTGALPMSALSPLTPPVSGSLGLAEAIPGVSDADFCQGNVPPDKRQKSPRWLQFELLGPVHYWVLGSISTPRKIEFDYVRRVEPFVTASQHGLKLRMQEHIAGGDGWDVPESRGRFYDLTAIERGSRVEIPELSATFVRCDIGSPLSRGIHRW
ncbi:MAG TPA: hypothetical protein VH722_15000 [Alphaproteobacteria bacterium]|jgi:hypothetical protein|nr:hypothetical protein [Alphaproteobacteria bacterium]